MSRIYWVRYVAALIFQILAIVVIGQLALTMGMGLWSQAEINRNSYREYQRRAEREERESAKQIAEKCGILFKSAQPVAECLVDGIKAHHDQANTDQDLQAQQQMAFWTQWGAIATLFGVPVGILGLLGLFWSLRQTRAAISNDRELGNAEIRAYVSVAPLQLTDFRIGGNPVATFGIENKGTTPAYATHYMAMVAVLPFPLTDGQGDLVVPQPDQRLPDQALHAGGKIIGEAPYDDGEHGAPLSEEDFKRALAGKEYRLYLAGRVGYRDVFKIDRVTKFCAYIEADDLNRALKSAAVAGPGKAGQVPMDWLFAHVQNEST